MINWVVLSLTIIIAEAFVAEFNRHYKFDGFALNFWRTLVAALVVSMFSMHYQWPSDPNFYWAGLVVGIVAATCMIIRLNLSAQHNGRVSSLFIPLKAFLLFGTWWIFDISSYVELAAEPWKLVGIIATFIVASASMISMRKIESGPYILLMVSIVAVLYAIEEGVVKIMLEDSVGFEGAFMLTTLGYWIGVILSGIVMICAKSHRKYIWDKTIVKPAIVMGITSACIAVSFFKALALTPNPAYISVIMMQVPVLLMIYHKAVGLKDNASPIAGLFLVLSAITLILITSG